MPDILFLPLDLASAPEGRSPDALSDDRASIDAFADALDLAFTFGAPASAPSPALPWSPVPDDPHAARDAAAAARASHDGRVAALAGAWDDAAAALAASAARRTALVARGVVGPAVAARGWSDVAVLAAARGDAVGAADALARARAVSDAAAPVPAVAAALAEVVAWLAALAGASDAPPEASGAWPDVRGVPTAGAGAFDLLDLGAVDSGVPGVAAIDPGATGGDALVVAGPEFGIARSDMLDVGVLDVGVLEVDMFEVDMLDRGCAAAVEAAVAAPVGEAAQAATTGDHADLRPAPVATAPSTAADLTFLELEGPLRVWELPPGTDDASQTVCAVPPRAAGPLAPPLPSALQTPARDGSRNAAVDAVVALTEVAEPRDGRLRSLLRRITRR